MIIDHNHQTDIVPTSDNPHPMPNTLFENILSDDLTLSKDSLKLVRTEIKDLKISVDSFVELHGLDRLETLFSDSRDPRSIIDIGWILCHVARSNVENCSKLVTSGLCLSILHKSTPDKMTKDTAHVYVHLWKVLQAIAEQSTLSSDPTLLKDIPLVVADTISILGQFTKNQKQTQATLPFTLSQRSDLFRSFLGFVVNELMSCVVFGIETELFGVIQKNITILDSMSNIVAPNKITNFGELLTSIKACSTISTPTGRLLATVRKVTDSPSHMQVVMVFVLRFLSNSAHITDFISMDGFTIIHGLSEHLHLKSWSKVMELQTEIYLKLALHDVISCAKWMTEISYAITTDHRSMDLRGPKLEKHLRLQSHFWKLMKLYPEMTERNQQAVHNWTNSCLNTLLEMVCGRESEEENAAMALEHLVGIDSAELEKLFTKTPITLSPPLTFPLDTSLPDDARGISNLRDILSHIKHARSFHGLPKYLPCCLCNRMGELYEDEEANRDLIAKYDVLMTRYFTIQKSQLLTPAIFLLFSLVKSPEVKRVLVKHVPRSITTDQTLVPLRDITKEEAILEVLLTDGPDTPSVLLPPIEKKLLDEKKNSDAQYVFRLDRPYVSLDFSAIHSSSLSLLSSPEGRWTVVAFLAVIPIKETVLSFEQTKGLVEMAEEAASDERLVVVLRALTRHTLTELSLPPTSDLLSRLLNVIRPHSLRSDNAHLSIEVFSLFTRLLPFKPTLEKEAVECARQLLDKLVLQQMMILRFPLFSIWHCEEDVEESALLVLGECVRAVQHGLISDPLPLVPTITHFVCTRSTSILAKVLDFLKAVEDLTQHSPTPFAPLSLPIPILSEERQVLRTIPLHVYLAGLWGAEMKECTKHNDFWAYNTQPVKPPMIFAVRDEAEVGGTILVMKVALDEVNGSLKDMLADVEGRPHLQTIVSEREEEDLFELIKTTINTGTFHFPVNRLFVTGYHVVKEGPSLLVHIIPHCFSLFSLCRLLQLVSPPPAAPPGRPVVSVYVIMINGLFTSCLNELRSSDFSYSQLFDLCAFFAFISQVAEHECRLSYDQPGAMLAQLQDANKARWTLVNRLMFAEGFEDRRDQQYLVSRQYRNIVDERNLTFLRHRVIGF
ncbi:hypothetical protein BLNAU_20385 [Blattamonas nauphoetae]|uniref:Uncharacterized protein n=1 Tax=Blattamonas nauphoetae TaxID=2049346 RepID=A0ABQ9WZ17_9EUKA|nr:hypothetical protein BLNAU_20385 [Blattamonas nauphoetae]